MLACGTAAYAGKVAKYAIENWCRIPTEVELAHEFRYRDPILDENTLVVSISPVRRDHGHPDGRPVRPGTGRQDHLDLQHQRVHHPA